MKTWKQANDPDFEVKKNRILELYDSADGKIEPGPGDPTVVVCVDEFGPSNLQPHPGRQWAAVGGTHTNRDRQPRRRRRATYTRPHGVRHLLTGYDLSTDRLYGTSSDTRDAPSSSPSAATSVRYTHPRCASPS